jgi:hypothetical protein
LNFLLTLATGLVVDDSGVTAKRKRPDSEACHAGPVAALPIPM